MAVAVAVWENCYGDYGLATDAVTCGPGGDGW